MVKERKVSIARKCFHNNNGECHFLGSDIQPCHGVCPNFTSFDDDLRKRVNRRIKQKNRELGLTKKDASESSYIGRQKPMKKVPAGSYVSQYDLHRAFGGSEKERPKKDELQGTLNIG